MTKIKHHQHQELRVSVMKGGFTSESDLKSISDTLDQTHTRSMCSAETGYYWKAGICEEFSGSVEDDNNKKEAAGLQLRGFLSGRASELAEGTPQTSQHILETEAVS